MPTGNADYDDFESMLDLPQAAGDSGGGGEPPMSNPDNKQLHANGKEMNLTASQISFISDGLSLLMGGSGIEGTSDKKITIAAEEKVEISGKTVKISSDSTVILGKR